VALHVKKSGKSKKYPALFQHCSFRFFFSQRSLGVSISSEILPPTYFRTGCFRLLMNSASSKARWSNQRITFCSLFPAQNLKSKTTHYTVFLWNAESEVTVAIISHTECNSGTIQKMPFWRYCYE